MGKTISLWAVLATLLFAGFSKNASITTDKDVFTIVESTAMTMTVDSEEDFKFFLKADYDDSEKEITFLTKDVTTQIRVYGDNEDMMYLLPVGSDRVSLGNSLFDPGIYKLLFDSEKQNLIYKSELVIQ